jgi:protoporphyrinogen IX oxidase
MLWLKAFHLIFMVCWFAGLFYLPRILVYFAANEDAATRAQLAIMARKLYRFVTPFMLLTIVFGVALIGTNPGYYLASIWLWAKLAGVACLVLYHLQCGRYVRDANADNNRHGQDDNGKKKNHWYLVEKAEKNMAVVRPL